MIGYGRPLTNLFDDDRPWSTMAEHGHLWFGHTIRLSRLLYVWLDQLSSGSRHASDCKLTHGRTGLFGSAAISGRWVASVSGVWERLVAFASAA